MATRTRIEVLSPPPYRVGGYIAKAVIAVASQFDYAEIAVSINLGGELKEVAIPIDLTDLQSALVDAIQWKQQHPTPQVER